MVTSNPETVARSDTLEVLALFKVPRFEGQGAEGENLSSWSSQIVPFAWPHSLLAVRPSRAWTAKRVRVRALSSFFRMSRVGGR